MELYIKDETVVFYDHDPGEKGIRENGQLVTPDIPESVQITGLSIAGHLLTPETQTAVLQETNGRIDEMCMEQIKEMKAEEEREVHQAFEIPIHNLKRGLGGR